MTNIKNIPSTTPTAITAVRFVELVPAHEDHNQSDYRTSNLNEKRIYEGEERRGEERTRREEKVRGEERGQKTF